MMDRSPRFYIHSFVEIGLQVLKRKIFEGFLTIYGREGHLGHVTKMLQTNFSFPTQGGST